jgi:hypothetical protein
MAQSPTLAAYHDELSSLLAPQPLISTIRIVPAFDGGFNFFGLGGPCEETCHWPDYSAKGAASINCDAVGMG